MKAVWPAFHQFDGGSILDKYHLTTGNTQTERDRRNKAFGWGVDGGVPRPAQGAFQAEGDFCTSMKRDRIFSTDVYSTLWG
jgi:hypothetical protein